MECALRSIHMFPCVHLCDIDGVSVQGKRTEHNIRPSLIAVDNTPVCG